MTRRMKPGPSNAYVRLLQGKIDAGRYCAILRRAVRMYGRAL